MLAKPLTRRRLLQGAALALGSGALAGCREITTSPTFAELLHSAHDLNNWVQRLLIDRNALAKEFTAADISDYFKPNGTQDSGGFSPDYMEDAAAGFPAWRLVVDGLVQRPRSYTLADIRAMPSRHQITRHDCIEGWSCIGAWRGPQLSLLLEHAGLLPQARYIVFWCADDFPFYFDGRYPYYESIDLIDAFHPQTILAHEMNGVPLPFAYGAPLRLRVERQLGYKMAKYVHRIEAVESFEHIRGGRGGYWPDNGYSWWAGI